MQNGGKRRWNWAQRWLGVGSMLFLWQGSLVATGVRTEEVWHPWEKELLQKMHLKMCLLCLVGRSLLPDHSLRLLETRQGRLWSSSDRFLIRRVLNRIASVPATSQGFLGLLVAGEPLKTGQQVEGAPENKLP